MGTPTILVADDSRDDVFILQHAVEKLALDIKLEVVRDGQDAVDYLARTQSYAASTTHPLPVLLLLDLKMPRLNGFDVLYWVRAQPAFHRLPIVIFSSSDAPEDVRRAYEMGATAYITKPSGLQEVEKTVRIIHDYWLQLNQFSTLHSD